MLMAAVGAQAYEGPMFPATVWRGETAYVRIPPKFVGEIGCVVSEKLPKGLSVGLYARELRKYAVRPESAHVGFRYDGVRDCGRELSAGKVVAPAFCRIQAEESLKAGKYVFGPLELTVLDRVLPPPSEWKYLLDLWQHPWAVARYRRVKPFSPEHYAAMEPVWKSLAACGVKVLTTTLIELPWNHQCYDAYHSMIGRARKEDGSWAFDYRLFDEYVAFGRRCGIGPGIACYTMCPWDYVVRWQDEKGEIRRVKALPGTPEFEDYWGAFLVDFAAHLKAKGWFDDTFIAMDEREPKDVRLVADFIQSKVPGFRIAMAGNRKPSEFAGIAIDSYSQYLGDMTDSFLAELKDRREKGFKTTFYVCCNPERPNTFMTSEDDEAFWLGAYPALVGLDGFLRWAANSWPCDPYEDAAFGRWTPGDSFLIYPDGTPSTRLIALRAGVIAAEKMRLVNADGALDAELKDFNEKYSFGKALKGSFDFGECRREIEAHVNR